HRLGDDIGNRHALNFGHRGVSIRLTAITADEFRATVADPSSAVDPRDARYTTSTNMTGLESYPAGARRDHTRAPSARRSTV
ncbi:MAG: hypothetical protein WBP81_30455, partial [Solirubrobacteraceae bacterium]